MKKLVTLFLLLSISFSSHSFGLDSLKKTVNNGISSVKEGVSNSITKTDTSSNFKMIYSDLKFGVKSVGEALKSLAVGLKTSAETVFSWIAKKYFIQGIYDIIVSAFCFFIAYLLFKFLYHEYKKYSVDDNYPEHSPIYLFIIIGIIALTVIGFNETKEGLAYLINPEYYALEEVIEKIKQLNK